MKHQSTHMSEKSPLLTTPLLGNLVSADIKTKDYNLLREKSVENFREYWGLSVNDLKQLTDPKDRFWSHYKMDEMDESCSERDRYVERLAKAFDKYFSYKHELKQIEESIQSLQGKLEQLRNELKAYKSFKGEFRNEVQSKSDILQHQIEILSKKIEKWQKCHQKIGIITQLSREDKAILFRFHEVCVDGSNQIQYDYEIHRKVRFMWFTHVLYQYGRSVLRKIKDTLNIEELMKNPTNPKLKGYFRTFGVIISQVYAVSRSVHDTFDYPVVQKILRGRQEKKTSKSPKNDLINL